MVKKINRDAIAIKELLQKGMRQCEICRILKLKRAKVNYWAKTEIKESQSKKKKLNSIYLERIKRWANNKTTSTRSSRIISGMINSILEKRNVKDKKGKQMTIHYTTINRYLKEYYGKPRKIRKVFYLSEEQKKKRVDFCKKILERGIKAEQIFFTDESNIQLGAFTNDYIRLDPNKKPWDESTYELINRPTRKFEKSITIAGGINYYGLGKLIFLDGTMNEFSYGQALLFYQDDISRIAKKACGEIILEQDGASSHTSKSNIFLLNKLFKKDGWIQNPPNSPDLAYPIERMWGIIKPRVKRRGPKSVDELKKFLLEEWNSVPLTIVQNLCKEYLAKLRKCVEIGGARIEPEYFPKKPSMPNKWEIQDNLPKQRIIYNNKRLILYKKHEIKILKRQLKEIKSNYSKKIKKKKKANEKKAYKKRDLRLMTIGNALSIINDQNQGVENQKKIEEKNKIIEELELKINSLSKKDVFQYLRYLNGEEEEKEEGDSVSTVDDKEGKIFDLEELIKVNKEIKYKLKI